ncbi:MAG: hypothetical protein CME65_04390 [Halobacteriovoraceae bacterium]|nr:hypothetical protein [Halobacteriovoraceae bacterium]|tara:strand:- start:1442 stop:2665 length:1224 start_codon:yes stop_codon:yes gene_type:complete
MVAKRRLYNPIMLGLVFLALGLLTSPTIVAGYHILLLIPTIILFAKGQRIELPKSSYILIALFAWGVVCNIVNLDELAKPPKAFQELKFYLFGVIFLIPIKYYLKKQQNRHTRFILSTLFVTIIAAFIVGVSKAYLGFDLVKMQAGDFKPRSDGFLNYMRYGYGSAFLFLLGWAYYLRGGKYRRWLNKKLFLTALALCLAAIFAAKTRGALLAVLVGLPFFYLKYKPKLAGSIIALGSIFAGVIIYFSFFTTEPAPSRFLNINDGSNKKRMSQFYTATKAIAERPVFGWGAEQFTYRVSELKKKYSVWSQDYAGHTHNIFLEHAVSFGILGAILLFGFFALWFYEMLRLKTDMSWAVATYIIAFVVGGQVEMLFENLNSHLLCFIYSLSHVIPALKAEGITLKPKRS